MKRHMHPPTRLSLITLSIFAIAALAAFAVAQSVPDANAPAPAVNQQGPTIKDAYAKSFLIGTAGDIPGNYSGVELGLIKENFTIVTPWQ